MRAEFRDASTQEDGVVPLAITLAVSAISHTPLATQCSTAFAIEWFSPLAAGRDILRHV